MAAFCFAAITANFEANTNQTLLADLGTSASYSIK